MRLQLLARFAAGAGASKKLLLAADSAATVFQVIGSSVLFQLQVRYLHGPRDNRRELVQ